MNHTLPDGLQLYYEIHGPDNADKTLVLLNGLSQSTAAWGGLMPLTKKYRLVLVDLVMQGQSDTAEEFRHFEEHAADVADLLASLKLSNVTIIGISYGGAVAQRVLVNHPDLVKGGILISSFAKKDLYFKEVGNSWKKALEHGGYDLMLDIMLPIVLGRSYFLDPLIPIDVLKSSKTSESPATENLLKLMKATEASDNFLPELNKINVPVLVLHGEEDMLCTPAMGRDIHEAIPGSKFEVFKNVGHTLNLEAIPQLTKAIVDFVG